MSIVRKHYPRTRRPLQHGLSLVELLVAMTVGLLLTAGVLTVFVNSKQTYRVQDNLSHLQENGRFALILLGNALRMAGYKTDPINDTRLVFPTGAIYGTDTTGSPDAISISFQGAADGTTRDCLGNSVGASVMSTNRFFIDNNDLALKCTSSGTYSALG